LRTKDSGCLNPVSIVLNLPACFLWCAYGVDINEIVVSFPNLIEFVLVFF
jgi:hypothetical protein